MRRNCDNKRGKPSFPQTGNIKFYRYGGITNFPLTGNKEFSSDAEYQVFQRWRTIYRGADKSLARPGKETS